MKQLLDYKLSALDRMSTNLRQKAFKSDIRYYCSKWKRKTKTKIEERKMNARKAFVYYSIVVYKELMKKKKKKEKTKIKLETVHNKATKRPSRVGRNIRLYGVTNKSVKNTVNVTNKTPIKPPASSSKQNANNMQKVAIPKSDSKGKFKKSPSRSRVTIDK